MPNEKKPLSNAERQSRHRAKKLAPDRSKHVEGGFGLAINAHQRLDILIRYEAKEALRRCAIAMGVTHKQVLDLLLLYAQNELLKEADEMGKREDFLGKKNSQFRSHRLLAQLKVDEDDLPADQPWAESFRKLRSK